MFVCIQWPFERALKDTRLFVFHMEYSLVLYLQSIPINESVPHGSVRPGYFGFVWSSLLPHEKNAKVVWLHHSNTSSSSSSSFLLLLDWSCPLLIKALWENKEMAVLLPYHFDTKQFIPREGRSNCLYGCTCGWTHPNERGSGTAQPNNCALSS